jgi:transcriptional regulator with XRE-family HTH domain
MFVTHPEYLRLKARELRVERKLSLEEIAERLALPKTTIFSWIKDIPLQRPAYVTEARERAWAANSERYRLKREAAYAEGVEQYPALAARPTFTEFVALYIAEGSKRERNQVKICNSDPDVMTLAVRWMRTLTERRLDYTIQYHADQDLDELRRFWGELLNFEPDELRLQRKSNSKQLAGRHWRSLHGVLGVRVSDTMLRARLQAWIDLTKASWQ